MIIHAGKFVNWYLLIKEKHGYGYQFCGMLIFFNPVFPFLIINPKNMGKAKIHEDILYTPFYNVETIDGM